MDSSFEFNCPKFYDFTAPTPSIPKKRKHAGDETVSVKKQKCSPTLAEKVYNFQHGISRRFEPTPVKPCEKPSLTLPKPFQLHTSERAELKPSATVPNEFIPLSVQIARWLQDTPPRLKREAPICDVRQLERTIPQPFSFKTTARAENHKPIVQPPPPTPCFKATPLDRRIFESEIGIRKVEKKPSTVPEEFQLTKREAERIAMKRPCQPPQTPFHFKAQPILASTPFNLVLPHRKLTATPFQLATDTRGSMRKRSETERCPATAFKFKAQPWSAEDFVCHPEPRVPPRPLTEIQGFALRSDQRASLRAVWEEERRQKERQKEEALARRDKENQEKARQDIKALRRSMVHRPQPINIPNFKSVRYSTASATPRPTIGEQDALPSTDATADMARAEPDVACSPAKSFVSSPLLTMR